MQKWTRWQGLVALLVGLYAALSPMWTETDNTATWTIVVLGAVTAAVALWSLARSDDRTSAYALVLLGVLFVASPWVMRFDDLNSMAVTAWVAGVITAICGVMGMPEIEHRIHLGHGPIAH